MKKWQQRLVQLSLLQNQKKFGLQSFCSHSSQFCFRWDFNKSLNLTLNLNFQGVLLRKFSIIQLAIFRLQFGKRCVVKFDRQTLKFLALWSRRNFSSVLVLAMRVQESNCESYEVTSVRGDLQSSWSDFAWWKARNLLNLKCFYFDLWLSFSVENYWQVLQQSLTEG